MSSVSQSAPPRRSNAAALLIGSMAGGALLALVVVDSGADSTPALAISLILLALVGGVLSNWSP